MKSYQSIISKLLFISIFIKHVDLHYFRLTNTNLKSYITNASKRFNNPVNILSFFSFCIKNPREALSHLQEGSKNKPSQEQTANKTKQYTTRQCNNEKDKKKKNTDLLNNKNRKELQP